MKIKSNQYLSDYITALARGLYRSFEITDTLIVGLIIALGAWGWYSGVDHPAHPPWWVITILVALLVLHKILSVPFRLYREQRQARDLLEMSLVPRLTPADPHVASGPARVGAASVRCAYARVRITNKANGIANGCFARLHKIEHLAADGWHQLPYNDTLDMAWANKSPDNAREVNIPANGTDILDVVYAVEGSAHLHLATFVKKDYQNLLGQAGQYRFVFQLAAANSSSQTISLEIHWGLAVDTLSTNRISVS